MNGLNALRRLFGLHPMNEAASAEAPAPAAAPATEAPAAPAAAAEPAAVTSLLGDEAAPTGDAASAEQIAKDGEAVAAKAEEAAAAQGAPETYEAFTAPEGIELNPEIMPELGEVFRDLGLPQDKAQAVLNRLLEIQAKAEGTPEQQIEAQNQQIADLNAQLAEQTRNLPDIGGENFGKSLEVAAKVMAQFGTPELRELIKYTAVGSHPEFFKFVHKIGQAMASDSLEHGGEATKAKAGSIVDAFYPGQ